MRRQCLFVILALLLAAPTLVRAQSWKQVTPDMFVDQGSMTRSFDAVNVNVKYLYDASDAARLQKGLKAKDKPQFSVQRKSFFCSTKKVSTSAYTYYSAAGTVIAQGTLQAVPKSDVQPDSRIEPVFDFVCGQR